MPFRRSRHPVRAPEGLVIEDDDRVSTAARDSVVVRALLRGTGAVVKVITAVCISTRAWFDPERERKKIKVA